MSPSHGSSSSSSSSSGGNSGAGPYTPYMAAAQGMHGLWQGSVGPYGHAQAHPGYAQGQGQQLQQPFPYPGSYPQYGHGYSPYASLPPQQDISAVVATAVAQALKAERRQSKRARSDTEDDSDAEERARRHKADTSRSKLLGEPDHYAPGLRSYPNKITDQIIGGIYVHINKLQRKSASLRDPSSRVKTKLADGYSLVKDGDHDAQETGVDSGAQWLRVFQYSVIAAGVAAIKLAESDAERVRAITNHQAAIVYSLHAARLFDSAHYRAKDVITYLEQHRQNCYDNGQHELIAIPDHEMLATIRGAALTDGRGSNTTGVAHSSSASSKAATRGNEICGNFNGPKGCKWGDNCHFRHVCIACKAAGHNKSSCPDKGTTGTIPKKKN